MRAKVEPDGVDTLVVDSARSAQVTGSSVAGSGSYSGDASQANAELRR
jgi:hypothetical protein